MADEGDGPTDGIAEGVRETFQNVATRMGDPFLLSLVIAWLTLNWRFLYTLFHERAGDEAPAAIIAEAERLLTTGRSLVAPVIVGAVYALLYPYVGGRIKVHRTKVLAQASKDAALERDKATGELETKRHEEELLARKAWLRGPEMLRVQRATEELANTFLTLTKALSVGSQSSHPKMGTIASVGLAPGFACRASESEIKRLSGPAGAQRKLVYVVHVFHNANKVLFVDVDGVFPTVGPRTTQKFEFLMADGAVESDDAPPPACVVHVEKLDQHWATFRAGPPKPKSGS